LKQELDKKFYPAIIKSRHIQYIMRYVDDQLTVFEAAITTTESISDDHNAMYPKITYNNETDNNQQINYSDLCICKKVMKSH
jgi:hypothetical protein